MRKFLLPLFLVAAIATLPIPSAFAKKHKNPVAKKEHKASTKTAKAQKKSKHKRSVASEDSHKKNKASKKSHKTPKDKKKKT